MPAGGGDPAGIVLVGWKLGRRSVPSLLSDQPGRRSGFTEDLKRLKALRIDQKVKVGSRTEKAQFCKAAMRFVQCTMLNQLKIRNFSQFSPTLGHGVCPICCKANEKPVAFATGFKLRFRAPAFTGAVLSEDGPLCDAADVLTRNT